MQRSGVWGSWGALPQCDLLVGHSIGGLNESVDPERGGFSTQHFVAQQPRHWSCIQLSTVSSRPVRNLKASSGLRHVPQRSLGAKPIPALDCLPGEMRSEAERAPFWTEEMNPLYTSLLLAAAKQHRFENVCGVQTQERLAGSSQTRGRSRNSHSRTNCCNLSDSASMMPRYFLQVRRAAVSISLQGGR